MDETCHKRRPAVARNGLNRVLKDTANSSNQNPQFCNRLGCSGRLKSMRTSETGCLQKSKIPKPLCRSSNGKDIVGSSSSTCYTVNNSKRSILTSLSKQTCETETDSSETSSIQDEVDVLELARPPGKLHSRLHSKLEDAKSGVVTFREVESSSSTTSRRPEKNINQKSRLSNDEPPTASSASNAAKSTSTGIRHGASASRYNMRSLRCSSTSDAIPLNPSSLESNGNRRKDMVKKRSSEGESSSTRGKKISGSSAYEEEGAFSSGHSISITDGRRSRNWTSSTRDSSIGSDRTRRTVNDNSRTRLSNQRNLNSLSIGPPVTYPQRELGGRATPISLPHQFMVNGSTSQPNSCNQPSSSRSVDNIMASGPVEVVVTGSATSRNAVQRYNVDGIAEVLLALERIQQDEEMTYEQLLVLETNLFLSGLAFHDRHREMRLDIDNMSYEELLDLEERMGTVSTALSEEELSKGLRRNVFHHAYSKTEAMSCGGDYDDVKCSICQEEYVDGEEVGTLQCEHRYHVVCAQQWLRLKNWCPICKAPASPKPSS